MVEDLVIDHAADLLDSIVLRFFMHHVSEAPRDRGVYPLVKGALGREEVGYFRLEILYRSVPSLSTF